jgi:ribosomal protein S18 acetylase RimI-like enzyme
MAAGSPVVSVVPMTLTDAPIVARLHATSWRRAYRGILLDSYLDGDLLGEREQLWRKRLVVRGDGHGWIAYSGGDAVGFVYLYPHHDARWGTLVDNLHVLGDYQGLGIGRALLAEVGRWCATQAPDAGVHLWVFAANTPARGFYRRVGGHEVEAIDELASDGRLLPELRVAWQSPAALLDGVGVPRSTS